MQWAAEIAPSLFDPAMLGRQVAERVRDGGAPPPPEVAVLAGTPAQLVGPAQAIAELLVALAVGPSALSPPSRLRLGTEAAGPGELLLRAVVVGAVLSGPLPAPVRHLLDLTGARLSGGSDGAGGASLELCIPVALPPRPAEGDPLVAWARGRGGRILVVDDSDTNRAVISALLAKVGFVVETAAGGAEGVAAVIGAPEPQDAVLMDVAMPEVDGIEATARIRALDSSRAETPIIAVTAHTAPEDRRRCFAAGMDDFVEKPVRRADLLGALHAALEPASRRIGH